MRKIFDIMTLKFILVGIVNTLVGTGVMFLLYNVFHTGYWIASASNYIVGSVVSYFLNKYFTFQNKQKSVRMVILFLYLLPVSIWACKAVRDGSVERSFTGNPGKCRYAYWYGPFYHPQLFWSAFSGV